MADPKPTPAPAAGSTGDPAFDALLERLMTAPASGGADVKQQALIGLPGGEQPERLEAEEPIGIGKYVMPRDKPPKYPRYFTGYQYMPQAMNWTPVEKRRLQNQLVNSGLLDKDYRAGAWDEPTQEAFASLLAMANQSGNDWETELINYANQQPMEYDPKTGKTTRKVGGGSGGSMAERQKLKLSYTNPNDLTLLANETAQKKLGRRLSPDELQKFVSSYQTMERDYQTASHQANEFGGSVTEPMGADTAALKAVEQADPVAFTTRSALPMVDAINEMLNGRDFGQAKPMGR